MAAAAAGEGVEAILDDVATAGHDVDELVPQRLGIDSLERTAAEVALGGDLFMGLVRQCRFALVSGMAWLAAAPAAGGGLRLASELWGIL
jgi:hypothetical protein